MKNKYPFIKTSTELPKLTPEELTKIARAAFYDRDDIEEIRKTFIALAKK